jgi:hypothetical protein
VRAIRKSTAIENSKLCGVGAKIPSGGKIWRMASKSWLTYDIQYIGVYAMVGEKKFNRMHNSRQADR